MEEREPIQVSFRLPAGTLEGLSRLVEQLRLLAAEVGGGAAVPAAPPAETGRSDQFDPRRYEALREGPPAPAAARAAFSHPEEARAVEGGAVRRLEEPPGAFEKAGAASPEEREGADRTPGASPEEVREPPPEETARREPPEGPEAVRAEAETRVEGPEPVRLEPESQLPAAEAAWTQNGPDTPAVQAARAEMSPGAEEPPSAGFTPEAVLEEMSHKRGSVSRELTEEGAAPMTAEAVSLAFRRDARRYDNGFPLY